MEVLGQHPHDLHLKVPIPHPVPQEICDNLASALLGLISITAIGYMNL
jgi:hypothetical protein